MDLPFSLKELHTVAKSDKSHDTKLDVPLVR